MLIAYFQIVAQQIFDKKLSARARAYKVFMTGVILI